MIEPFPQLTAAPNADPAWTPDFLFARSFLLHQSVDCPHCHVFYGESCIDPARKEIGSHKKRMNLIDKAWTESRFVVQISKAIEEFEGHDQFVASYDHDQGAIKLHYRMKDGAMAGMLVPRHDAAFMCWTDQLINLSSPLQY